MVRELERPLYIAEFDDHYYVIIENNLLQETEYRHIAFQMVMAYIWVFNLEYPTPEKWFFEFLQKEILNIDPSSPSQKMATGKRKILKAK